MSSRFALICIAIALCLLWQPQPSQGANEDLNIAAELDALTVAVNRLAAVIEQQQSKGQDQAQLQKLTQAIAYLNFRTRRIEQLENNVVAARVQRDDLEQMLKSWHERTEELEVQLKSAQGQEREDLTRRLEELKSRNGMTRKRIARIEEDLVLFENRARELQSDLSEIEAFVERNLKF